jgi:hypothetical protein
MRKGAFLFLIIIPAITAAVVGVWAVASISTKSAYSSVDPPARHDAVTSSSKLAGAYEKWRADHEANGGDSNVNLALRWHSALSSQRTTARGTAHLDLIEGSASVELEGLEELGTVDVWLVDNQDGDGRSVKPEGGDHFLYVGAIEPDAAGRGTFSKFIGAELRSFEVDLVMVTRKDASPTESGLLFGSLPLFQRLYRLQRVKKVDS